MAAELGELLTTNKCALPKGTSVGALLLQEYKPNSSAAKKKNLLSL